MVTKLRILVNSRFPYNINSPDISITSIQNCVSKSKWLRLIPSFILLYYLSFHFDVLMTDRKDGKFLGLLYYILKPSHKRCILYEFIYEFKSNLKGIISRFIWTIVLRKIDRVFVQSNVEISHYAKKFGVSKQKFVFIPFATSSKSFIGPSRDGYVFSAGRTNRDYNLLLNALGTTKIPCVVVASARERRLFHNVPPNVKVFFDINKDEYQQQLSKSRLVVIPLKKGFSSRGQVVILEAMAYGKPVICTDIPVIKDYIADGSNGFLIPANDGEALRKKVLFLFNNELLLYKVGKEGYHKVQKIFNQENFTEKFLKGIKNAVEY